MTEDSQLMSSLFISISQLPSPQRVEDYRRLVIHLASEGGYLEIGAQRYAPTRFKGTAILEGAVHTVMGDTVDDVVHGLADRVGAI